AGAPGGQRVIGRIDVVRPALEGRNRQPTRGKRCDQPRRDGGLAAAAHGRGDDQARRHGIGTSATSTYASLSRGAARAKTESARTIAAKRLSARASRSPGGPSSTIRPSDITTTRSAERASE